MSPADEPLSYVIRLRERAMRDIDAAYVRLAEAITEHTAAGWLLELEDALASLALFPERCPVTSEPFRHEVRQLLFRRSGTRMAYRILFTIIDEDSASGDPPTVLVLTVRHASARPISRRETGEIESEL